ncbi:acetyl-CoA hydrolase/transferase family protein, partial [Deinococcus cellulosilyticus]
HNMQALNVTLEEAASWIQPYSRVFLSGNAATPIPFLEALETRTDRLKGVEFCGLLQMGTALKPEAGAPFHYRSFFLGPHDRMGLANGVVDYVPIFLSEIPRVLRSGHLPLDWAVVMVSPPDAHGYMSLGTEVIASKAAVENAARTIALVNPHMPRVHGDCFIHTSQVFAQVEVDCPLQTLDEIPFTEVEAQLGAHIAQLIEDGDTLQLGIGNIPNAVLHALKGKKDLGLHTEMVSTGILRAVQEGIITGARKTLHPEKIIGTLMLGTQELYDFAHDNPLLEMHPSDYVNNPMVIAQNRHMVAINTALEVDLTGQVCADSIGTRMYSGFGGQLDFMRGASMSEGGKPIIAVTSTANVKSTPCSRITPLLKPGSGVVTTRGDVRYVVTEYGIADLYGRTLSERAEALIGIAHPAFREELHQGAWNRGLFPRAINLGLQTQH